MVELERSWLRSPFVQSSEFVHPAYLDSTAHLAGGRVHSAHIPDHENFLVIARTVQGMGRVRSGQAERWRCQSGCQSHKISARWAAS